MTLWLEAAQIANGALSLEHGSIYARRPSLSDYEAWAELRGESRDFLAPWEPEWGPDELTRTTYRRRLRRYSRDLRDDLAYPFYIFRYEDGAMVGGCNLSNVRRGAACSASLGYWVGAPFRRQGYTLSAVRAVTRFAFNALHLHRLEAACQPDNAPSRNLLEKVGFQEEGLARKYLKINGVWRDHILYARLNDLSPQ